MRAVNRGWFTPQWTVERGRPEMTLQQVEYDGSNERAGDNGAETDEAAASHGSRTPTTGTGFPSRPVRAIGGNGT